MHGQLVLTKAGSTTNGSTVEVNETGLAMGRYRNAMGSIWVYFKGADRPVARGTLVLLPMTSDWINHPNDLADKKPFLDDIPFEFNEGINATEAKLQEMQKTESDHEILPDLAPRSSSTQESISVAKESNSPEMQYKIQRPEIVKKRILSSTSSGTSVQGNHESSRKSSFGISPN